MLEILRNRDYRLLFSAQVVALLGTGLLTMALALAAYDIAKADAGRVLATALTIKMLVYIVFSPIAVAVTSKLDRKMVMIASDIIRAATALLLPFIDSVWHIYILIFILQAASSTFTPTFQALIPEVLTREKHYTKALSLTRLTYDLENIASPLIAGLLLTIVSYHWLFTGTAIGFVFSSFLLLFVLIPARQTEKKEGFVLRLTKGAKLYLATPRLRGLLSLNMAAAAIGAMVLVNTVVIVNYIHAGSETGLAVALGAFGLGSMVSALVLPRFLDHLSDRVVMTSSAALAAVILIGAGTITMNFGWISWKFLLVVWFLSGISYAGIITPSGRLLRRSADENDRPALYAAQFSLSHMCWLVSYPIAGYLGKSIGMEATMVVLGLIAGASLLNCLIMWPVTSENRLRRILTKRAARNGL